MSTSRAKNPFHSEQAKIEYAKLKYPGHCRIEQPFMVEAARALAR